MPLFVPSGVLMTRTGLPRMMLSRAAASVPVGERVRVAGASA